MKRSPMKRTPFGLRTDQMTPSQRVLVRTSAQRRVSKTKQADLDAYAITAQERREAFPVCERCGQARGEHIHHVAGRLGAMLSAYTNLRHLCARCHEAVHAHPALSYEQGWLERKNAVSP